MFGFCGVPGVTLAASLVYTLVAPFPAVITGVTLGSQHWHAVDTNDQLKLAPHTELAPTALAQSPTVLVQFGLQ